MLKPAIAESKVMNVLMDGGDYAELERLAKAKRSTVSQVARELIVGALDRQRRLEAAEMAS